jgi:hypothetical protein
MPTWVTYVVIAAVVLPLVIVRQLRTRTLDSRRLLLFPAIFLILAFATDHELLQRLASAPALTMLAAGIVLAALTGWARAATMRVWRVGPDVMTKGNGVTLALWVATIALRVGEVVVANRLGVPEGTGEALLFAAATFGAQSIVLAWRGGLLAPGRAPALERVE